MGLECSKLVPRQAGELVKLFVAGATARTAGELAGTHRSAAALFFTKVRAAIAAHRGRAMADAFGGPVETGESSLGGHREGRRGRGRPARRPCSGVPSGAGGCTPG